MKRILGALDIIIASAVLLFITSAVIMLGWPDHAGLSSALMSASVIVGFLAVPAVAADERRETQKVGPQ